MMDEAILINPSFVKKTSSEDDGLSLGQSSSKSYQAWSKAQKYIYTVDLSIWTYLWKTEIIIIFPLSFKYSSI